MKNKSDSFLTKMLYIPLGAVVICGVAALLAASIMMLPLYFLYWVGSSVSREWSQL